MPVPGAGGLVTSRASQLESRVATARWISVTFFGLAIGLFFDAFTADEISGRRAWAPAGSLVASLVGFIVAWLWQGKRQALDRETGSAYIVEAQADGWRSDALKPAFLAQVDHTFSRRFNVAGARDLNSDWAWPYQGPGLTLWSGGVDDVVLSFRTLHRTDHQITPNNIIAYMPWPAAMALTARLKSAEQGLQLRVPHRSSGAREGEYVIEPGKEPPHTFVREQADRTHSDARRVDHQRIPLVFDAVGFDSQAPDLAPGSPSKVRVLLVRATSGRWCGLDIHGKWWSRDDDASTDAPLKAIKLQAARSVGLPAKCDAELLEWQWTPETGVKGHPWARYPAICHAALDWIAENALPDGITLLGVQVPQEVSVGFGIDLATRHASWPARIWPIYVANPDTPPCVPGLNLGAPSLLREAARPRC